MAIARSTPCSLSTSTPRRSPSRTHATTPVSSTSRAKYACPERRVGSTGLVASSTPLAARFVHTTLVSPYNNLQRYQNNLYDPDSKAAFVNVTLQPFEKLGFTLGGRYSDDKKPVRYSNLQDATPTGQHHLQRDAEGFALRLEGRSEFQARGRHDAVRLGGDGFPFAVLQLAAAAAEPGCADSGRRNPVV